MGNARKRNVIKREGQSLPTTHPRRVQETKKFKFEKKYLLLLIIGLGCGYLVTGIVDSWWKSKLVYTQFGAPVVQNKTKNLNRFWGTYRPQVYMGMKTKSAQSLVTGLMWLQQNVQYGNNLPLRHACDQGDGLLRYGWLAHDGVNFGIQDIVERGFVLRTEFVKQSGGQHGGDWTWRISGIPSVSNPVVISLFFYAATDGQGKIIPESVQTANGEKLQAIRGATEELGKFTITFPDENQQSKAIHHTLITKAQGLHRIKEAALSNMQVSQTRTNDKPGILYFLKKSSNSDVPNPKSDVVFHQVTLNLPFEFDIVFESASNDQRLETLTGSAFTKALTTYKSKFDQKFESKFPLKDKGYDAEHINFAKAALSNLIGGIGHFYGHSFVQSKYQNQPVKNWDAHLLTAVPSRSFFPRGFLWDEGFHQLLVSKWDRNLSEEILTSWLNLINAEGWIPREQILGDEARSKVPAEFIVQRNTNANPPTLFLTIDSIMKDFEGKQVPDKDKEFLSTAYPRLKAWYDWFNRTQAGPEPSSYRWRGRIENTDSELNPKTLTSGLDDYPRASHPSSKERHVDLRCWMALASHAMANIARLVYGDGSFEAKPYSDAYELLTDLDLLNKLHWSSEMGLYSDYGNHTDRASLKKKTFQPNQQGQQPYTKVIRVVKRKPSLQFVNAYGYVSLFPFLLQILPSDSQQLSQILQDLKGEDAIWTEFGLRSLSKRDALYKKRNTEHDPPYWRGQIWVNINFLAVRALKHYSTVPGPFSALAAELYANLRKNLVQNMFKQYSKFGYLWENYDDVTGKGQGSHPFTGWSALVVLIMSEQY